MSVPIWDVGLHSTGLQRALDYVHKRAAADGATQAGKGPEGLHNLDISISSWEKQPGVPLLCATCVTLLSRVHSKCIQYNNTLVFCVRKGQGLISKYQHV